MVSFLGGIPTEPIVDEFLLGCFRVSGSPLRTYLPNLSNGTRHVSVIPVNHQELNVDHPFASWHNVLLR
jgi:hypothetical protein